MRQMRLWLGVGLVAVAAATLGFSVDVAATAPSDAARMGSPATTSTASGRCSKAEAIAVVKRLHLGEADFVPNPVWAVICGAFMGPGSQTMVVSLASGGASIPFAGWAVFRLSGGVWQLVMRRIDGAEVSAAGSDIRETVSVLRPGDQHCCPTGGTRSRIWHWNGTRFTASAWKQATKGEPERKGFYSPSRNIACGMFDDSSVRYVECQSRVPPQKARMDARGRVTICRDRTPNVNNDCNLGDPGEGVIPVLPYGKQITVGRFRCQSLQIGIRCTVIQSGKGFLINRDGVRRVGL